MARFKPRFRKSPLAAKRAFREALAEWFLRVGKDYPWRRTRDAYPILVSEIMLQQTQIATVLGKSYYTRFLEKFPTLESLARVDDESLLKAWEGLGYYRRARMLRETARAVLEKHDGKFPQEETELLDLPGVGPYTAAALMAFAYGRPSGLVDGNVSRVLSRVMADASPIDRHAVIRKHREWALELCDPERPDIHHHAMMELGQTICRPGLPDCERCPVSNFCACSEPEKLPVKKPGVAVTNLTEHAVFCRDSRGRILLHRETGKRRNGLWKLPLRAAAEFAKRKPIDEYKYSITRYRVTLKVYLIEDAGSVVLHDGDEWIPSDRLHKLPFAAPFKKCINRLSENY